MRTFIAAAAATMLMISAANAETYRLIHTIGNTEHEVARGLSKVDCDEQKKERKIIATRLGTYNERTGYGSIACIPESLFTD